MKLYFPGRSVGLLAIPAVLLILGSGACGSAVISDEPAKTGPADRDQPLFVPEEAKSPLLLPTMAREEAPDLFGARFETTKGTFVIQVPR